jgi:predicted PurR-regulated permease PerM
VGETETETESESDDASARVFPRGTAILLGLAGATVVAIGLSSIRSIAAPVLLSLILTICVHPLRSALERQGAPRGLATGSVATAVLLVLAAFMFALLLALAEFASLLKEYSDDLAGIGQSVTSALSDFGVGADEVEAIASGFDPTHIVEFVSEVLGSVAGLTGTLVIIFTTLLLMAMDASYMPTLLRQLEPSRPSMVASIKIFARSVRRYMVATTALGLVQGVLNGAALVILGVPGAFLWGLLSFVCSFIPNVGYLLAIIPPVFFGFLAGGWETALSVIVVYTLVNSIVQGAIQTRVVSNVVAISQTLTFVSVLLWAAIIGPIGALLATPLTLLVRMILVDSDTHALWWRPMMGDVAEARALMKLEAAQNKVTRRDEKLSRKPARPGNPSRTA